MQPKLHRIRFLVLIMLLLTPGLACQSNGPATEKTQPPLQSAPRPMETTSSDTAPTAQIESSTTPNVVTVIPNGGLLPAFPGAEGFGAGTPGGRGGRVIEVVNLNDSGPGSLRDALEAEGPRIVVFRIGGLITLETSLVITNPYITIAGQTAPGGGITIKHGKNGGIGIWVMTHDVVIRYLSIRPGPGGPNQAILISEINSDQIFNIIIDHCSLGWSTDEILTTWYDVHDISIQWNIFSEALDCSTHPKGCHSKGPTLGSYDRNEKGDGPGAKNISFHHNLVAHSGERNPLVKTAGVSDVVNNVVYNPIFSFSHVDMEGQLVPILANYVGNYFKAGPDSAPDPYGIDVSNIGPLGAMIYVQGNIGPTRLNDSLPEIDIVEPRARSYVVQERNPAVPVTTTSAATAYEQVLSDAGANGGLNCDGSWFARRDAIDTRIVGDVINGTGHIIDYPSEVGGWIIPASGVPCADGDHDGMPDLWETRHGLQPNDGADAASDADGDGYTNLEEYLNGTNPIE